MNAAARDHPDWHDSQSLDNHLGRLFSAPVPMPASCPDCAAASLHVHLHQFYGDVGGSWVWCSSCGAHAHARVGIPSWWQNNDAISLDMLASPPIALNAMSAVADKHWNDIVGESPASPHFSARLLVGGQQYEIEAQHTADHRSAFVTITVNAELHWWLKTAGWSELSLGATQNVGYFWSARDLVILPADGGELEVVSVDDDLIAVFKIDDRWLFVCETSVRIQIGNAEIDRLELGDTVASARVVDGWLLVVEHGGGRRALQIEGERLVARSEHP